MVLRSYIHLPLQQKQKQCSVSVTYKTGLEYMYVGTTDAMLQVSASIRALWSQSKWYRLCMGPCLDLELAPSLELGKDAEFEQCLGCITHSHGIKIIHTKMRHDHHGYLTTFALVSFPGPHAKSASDLSVSEHARLNYMEPTVVVAATRPGGNFEKDRAQARAQRVEQRNGKQRNGSASIDPSGDSDPWQLLTRGRGRETFCEGDVRSGSRLVVADGETEECECPGPG
ncbi:hypothetical protein AXG93_4666s1230 [Marchantia polymorpha subsp. ruderalis]|uniref:Uncharacterized protein n=1 Tax=Marchantia polymorpha subsp. ruderalis TaxID=1480154 RepID=A0A176W3R1_MARPO|nr:hypothetical protein AXG93_4666s1230 [Marchantia polymorpha subsp. ruderalis]